MTDKPSTDLGGMVRKLRTGRFQSRRQAAQVLSFTSEGLRKIENNFRIPSMDSVTELIVKWRLTEKEADELRYALHVNRQRRDGYAAPGSRDELGYDLEGSLAATIAAVLTDVDDMIQGLTDDPRDRKAVVAHVEEVLENHIRANFG